MKKIAYLTGTRAEFGLMMQILKGIESEKNLKLILIATGMHLLKEFGKTINIVETEFPKVKIIDTTYDQDDRLSMARFVTNCAKNLIEVLQAEKPDLVLILGDRGEQLAVAVAAAYLNVPIIHLHGGEKTTTIDDKARNAITMLADWHLPASRGAAKKIIRMGINKHQVKIVGAPGLDQIKSLPVAEKKDYLVILQHPDAKEQDADWQIKQTLEAAIEFKLPIKIIYPNSDAGGRIMIQVINEWQQKYPGLIEVFPNIEREQFLNLLLGARVLLGNSSCGLIEAPTLNLPAVNIGPRQKGREQTKNVINVDYNRKKIMKAISKALSLRLKNIKNPYGDGKTSERVIKFLKSL